MAELANFAYCGFLGFKGSLITIDNCSLLVTCMPSVAGVSCLDALQVYLIIW